MITIPIRSFDSTRQFLGMFHDGKDYRLAMWSNIRHYNNMIYVHKLDTKTGQFVTVTKNPPEGKIQDEMLDTKSIINFISPDIQFIIGTLTSWNAQFHFISINDELIVSSFYENTNLEVSFGFEVDCTYNLKWAERNLDNYMMPDSGFRGERFPDNQEFIGMSPFTINNIPILRNGNFKNQSFRRPISATKYISNNKFLFHYNTKTVYIFGGEKITRITKLICGQPIVDVKPSPDGKVLMVLSKSHIFLYRTADWTLIRVLAVQQNKIRHGLKFGSWAQDGLTFAVMCLDFVQVWDYDE